LVKKRYLKFFNTPIISKVWGVVEWSLGVKQPGSVFNKIVNNDLITNYWCWVAKTMYKVLNNRFVIKY